MKIFRFARKEFELIVAQRSSLALTIIYPLLIVLLIAVAFGGQEMQPQTGFERADVAYFLPLDSDTFNSEEFLDKLANIEKLQLHRAKDAESVKEAINQGIARIGIVVEEPATEFEKVNITLYYDNTSPLVSNIVMSYADFSISMVASEKSVNIITGIWNNLGNIKVKLSDQYKKISDFEKGIDEAKARVAGLEEKVNSIDIAAVKAKLNNFDLEYTLTKSEIASAIVEADGAKSKLAEYKIKLSSTRQELSEYSATLKSIRVNLQYIRASSPEPIATQLLDVENQLSSTITKIDASIAEIDSAIADIDQSQAKLNNVKSKLSQASAKLDSAKLAVDELRQTTESLEITIGELKAMISDSYEYYDATKENLAETKRLLDGMTLTLDELITYDPQYLVRPFITMRKKMYLDSEQYRSVEKTAILLPISLAIVLLLTCLLFSSISTIIERKQGISFRVQASTTSKLGWLGGKVLGLVLFGMAEAGIILAVAFLVLGVPLIGSALDLIIVIAAILLAFVSIGVFLSNFTSEQSTAVLASLLIMIPLIFLSGMLFPIEFMPFYIQGIASNLPLTLGTTLLTNVIVKGIPLIQSAGQLAVLIVPSIILLAFTLINERI